MTRCCAVKGCNNRSSRDKHKKFFGFPSVRDNRGRVLADGIKQREQWIKVLNRHDLLAVPTKIRYTAVCSDHFLSGYPASSKDTSNPDYVPTQKIGTKPLRNFTESALKRHQRAKNRIIPNAVAESCELNRIMHPKEKVESISKETANGDKPLFEYIFINTEPRDMEGYIDNPMETESIIEMENTPLDTLIKIEPTEIETHDAEFIKTEVLDAEDNNNLKKSLDQIELVEAESLPQPRFVTRATSVSPDRFKNESSKAGPEQEIKYLKRIRELEEIQRHQSKKIAELENIIKCINTNIDSIIKNNYCKIALS